MVNRFTLEAQWQLSFRIILENRNKYKYNLRSPSSRSLSLWNQTLAGKMKSMISILALMLTLSSAEG